MQFDGDCMTSFRGARAPGTVCTHGPLHPIDHAITRGPGHKEHTEKVRDRAFEGTEII